MNEHQAIYLTDSTKLFVNSNQKAMFVMFTPGTGTVYTISEVIKSADIAPIIVESNVFETVISTFKFFERHKDDFVIMYVAPADLGDSDFVNLCKCLAGDVKAITYRSMLTEINFQFGGKIVFLVREYNDCLSSIQALIDNCLHVDVR